MSPPCRRAHALARPTSGQLSRPSRRSRPSSNNDGEDAAGRSRRTDGRKEATEGERVTGRGGHARDGLGQLRKSFLGMSAFQTCRIR